MRIREVGQVQIQKPKKETKPTSTQPGTATTKTSGKTVSQTSSVKTPARGAASGSGSGSATTGGTGKLKLNPIRPATEVKGPAATMPASKPKLKLNPLPGLSGSESGAGFSRANSLTDRFQPFLKLPPEQQVLQLSISKLTTGKDIPAVNKDISRLVTQLPHLGNLFNKQIGAENTANILSGSMRHLAELPAGKANKLENYTRNVIQSPEELSNLSRFLKETKQKGQTEAMLKNFKALGGKDLYTVLGEKVTDPAARAKLLKNLPTPLKKDKVTELAFLESLASETVYSPETGKWLNESGKVNPKKGGVPTEVLKTFGYSAGDNLPGGWGFDMRVFTPKDKTKPLIVVMRGTEGISTNVNTNKPGATDSAIGDFAAKEPGINQFEPNLALLRPIVDQAKKNGQKIIWTGHSLGGALAQEGAATFPEATSGVTTFQGANIPKEYVDRFNAYRQAHPEAKIDVNHLRVEGDSVPTSGSAAIPGNIYYMDYVSKAKGQPGDMTKSPVSELIPGIANPLLKDAAGAVANKMPLVSTSSVSAGHVIPAANMFLRQEYGNATDPKAQALLKYGPVDPNTMTGKRESGVVYGGSYEAKNDPRLAMERQRADVMPKAMDLVQANEGVFKASGGFSNAQEYLVNSAKGFKTFSEFQKYASMLAASESLPMTPNTLAMAKQMHLDTSPRTNAKAAANDLFGVNLLPATTTGLTLGSKANTTITNAGRAADQGLLGAAAGTGVQVMLDSPFGKVLTAPLAPAAYLAGGLINYSGTPVMDRYKRGQGEGYSMPVDPQAQALLQDQDYLRNIWRLHNPPAGAMK